ncbi:MAG: glycosyltransferase family 4 protein [Deltaproteobacteria bacterium]|nr:glycosyltransferase family 4 protein [Deltaproteobacteria bacterium]
MSTFHRLGVPRNRLHLIRNGIDYGWFSAAAMTETQKSAWRRAHRIPLADLIAVCVARVDPLKNHGLLLQAVQYASGMGVQVVLVCVGEEIPGREAYRQSLEQMAERLGVADRVIWAGYQDDVRDWMAMADVAVLASRKEGVSLALTEAGAIGLPLMGSAVGGIPEIVRHGQTGLLFDAADVPGCAAAFVEFARNPEIRRTMGMAAQQLVRTEFNSTAWDEQWSRLLAGLAAGSSVESTL